jgi:hypothetical protein
MTTGSDIFDLVLVLGPKTFVPGIFPNKIKTNYYYNSFFILLERCETQSVAAQMLQTGGECEGRRLDCRRRRISQEAESQGEQPVDQVRKNQLFIREFIPLQEVETKAMSSRQLKNKNPKLSLSGSVCVCIR